MNRSNMLIIIVAVTALAAGVCAEVAQFRGPNRQGVFPGEKLLKQWPEGGPKQLWVSPVNIGEGYSSPTVTDDAIYVTGIIDKEGWVIALDLDGKETWRCKYGPEWTRSYQSSRTSPTYDDGRLYVMSGEGVAACIDTKTHELKWSVDTLDRFKGQNITWGIAESVLVLGDKVICTPGGPDATVVALNRDTGETIWTSKGLSDRSGYCSPILIKDGDRHLICTVTSGNIVGISPDDGTVLWTFPYANQCKAHACSPLYHDGRIYVTSGYDKGGVMLTLSADGKRVEKAWEDATLDTHHGGVVMLDGGIYGANWLGNGNGNWICLDWKTGQVKYDTHWKNKGSIISADGMLICYEEKGGNVALVKATPEGFQPSGTFQVDKGDGPHWAHPVIADGRLYIRHGSALMCYEIGAE